MKIKISFLLFFLLVIPSLSFGQGGAGKDTTLDRSSRKTEPSSSSKKIVKQKSMEAPPGMPTRAIQDLELKTEQYKTGPNLTAEDRAKNAQIKKEAITGTFNLRELCRLSLDKHWNERTAEEQNYFVNLMTQLLETKAILSKEQSKTQGKKYSVRYRGDSYLDAQKTKAKSRTSISIPKDDVKIEIDYKLVKTGSDWKIYDVIVDDASLVENYKYQFHSIITKYGYPELISRMKKKLSDLESKS